MISKSDVPMRNTASPLSRQIEEILLDRIQRGIYPAGSQLPREIDLCADFSVSRPTVRKALDSLEKQHLIVRVRPKGTFVSAHPGHVPADFSNAPQTSALNSEVKREVLQIAMEDSLTDLYQRNYFDEFTALTQCSVEQIHWNSWYAAVENIVNMYAQHRMPDIFAVSNDAVGIFARMGILRALDDFLEPEELQRIKARCQRYGLGAYVYDNHLYGYPFFSESRLLIYRKDHFFNAGIPDPCEYPLTHDSFLEIGKKLSNPDNGLYAFAYPVAHEPVTLQSAMTWIIQRGGSLLRIENGRVVPSTEEPEFVDALTWYTDLSVRHKICPQDPSTLSLSNIINMLRHGSISMMIATSGTYKWLVESTPDGNARYGIAPFPIGPVNNYTFLGGMPLCISSHCKQPELAWKLISYMNQPELLRTYCARTGALLPIERYDIEEIRKNADPSFLPVVDALETAVPHTYPVGYNQCLDFVNTGFWQIPLPQVLEMILRNELNVESATKFLSVSLRTFSRQPAF